MSNRAFYQKTFSQLHPAHHVTWEEMERMERMSAKRRPHRPIIAIAAAAALLAALSATAVAVNFLGVRDLLLPEKQQVGIIDPDTGTLDPDKTQAVDAISLSGYAASPESKALAEWEEFLNGYDPDKAILHQVGNYLDPALSKYLNYLVYTQDMADKLEEIAAKYGLKLHTQFIDLYEHPEALGPLADFAQEGAEAGWMYMYEDGSCHFDGSAYVEGQGIVDLQFQRAVKGIFNDVTLNIGDVTEYRQWNYQTACGVEVVLALGPTKALIYADLPDNFALLNVLCGTESGLTQANLEALAECFDYSVLTPVEPPQVTPDPEPIPSAQAPTDARSAYAAVLRAVLETGLLPDGNEALYPEDLSDDQFCIYDVDFDGAEELVFLHCADATAGMVGYVLDFDPTYTGPADPILFQMAEFPTLTFYENSVVKADWSHNQTWGELWPYSLYAYEPVSDSYYAIASVYTEDRAILEQIGRGEDYPAQIDTSGTGTVYHVTFSDAAEEQGWPAGEQVWDSEAYWSWLDSVLGRAQPLDLPYQALTEENIAAVLP